MQRSSKYAALAFLISTVGAAALDAADGLPPTADVPSMSHERVGFPRNTRAADRKARVVAQRLKAFTAA